MGDLVRNGADGIKRRFVDMGDGTFAEKVAAALSGGSSGDADRELVVTTYRAKTSYMGASAGDTITATQVIDVTDVPTTVATIWRNQSTATDLASAPAAANLETVGATALTDAQLRAAAVLITGTVAANTGLAQPLTDTQLRAAAVAVSGTFWPATQPVSAASLPLPTGAASAADIQAVRDRLPSAFLTPGLMAVDTLGTPGVARVQATSAVAASIVLTSTCRRVSMYATTGTWYSISGTATATSHYLEAGGRLDFDVPANTTISVLQETTAGSVRVTELS